MFRFGYGIAPLNCKLSEFNHEKGKPTNEPVKRKFYTSYAFQEEPLKYKKKKKLNSKPKTFEEELDLER